MAKKPTTSAALANEGDVIVEVRDALKHDGEDFGEGDAATMPLANALALRALGVVSFDDAAESTASTQQS